MDRTQFYNRIRSAPVLFDGGMGTQLIAAGMKRGDCSERWNLTQPRLVSQIHQAYRHAGADVLTTNTFVATRHHLEQHGLGEQLAAVNQAAARLAREVDASSLIAGDLGPTGLLYPPMGTATEAAVAALYSEQVVILHQAQVDFFLIETQYDLREALVAVAAVRALGDLPVGVTMTYNLKRRGYFTMVGDSVVTCCRSLEKAGVDFIGANCSLGPQDMVPLTKEIATLTSLPILIQPNAGQPHAVNETILYDVTPEAFAEAMVQIRDQGATMLGGCCGTTPAHIAALQHLLHSSVQARP